MKTLLFFSLLFCVLAQPLCAQSDGTDEALKTDIAVMKTDIAMMKTDIAVMKTELKHLKESIDNRFENVQKDFDNVQNSFVNIQKNFDRQNNIIIACIGLPLAILAIGATVWGILAHRRSVKDSTQQQEIETLKQEIETLKQRHIVDLP